MKNLRTVIVGLFCCLSAVVSAQDENTKPVPKHADAEQGKIVLSQIETRAVDLFKQKYQGFPGPTNDEVREIAKLLLRRRLEMAKVRDLLGDARPLSTPASSKSPQPWAYDIGDSRAIVVHFDGEGRAMKIVGVGVGFDELDVKEAIGSEVPNNDSGKK